MIAYDALWWVGGAAYSVEVIVHTDEVSRRAAGSGAGLATGR